MLEALILWQLGSARAEEKSRYRAMETPPGQGLAIFMMAVAFVATIFLWPLALGYRTKLLKKWPAVGWSLVPIFAFFFFLISPSTYAVVGFFWAIGEMTAYISRNEHMFN